MLKYNFLINMFPGKKPIKEKLKSEKCVYFRFEDTECVYVPSLTESILM